MSRTSKTNSRRSFNQTTLAQSLHQARHSLSSPPSITNSKSDRAGFADTLRRVLLGASGVGLVMASGAVMGSDIVKYNGDPGTLIETIGAGKYKITTGTENVVGQSAINRFQKFNLDANNVANMYLPDGTKNLLNFVNDRINIHGWVNSIKDNKIGGNLFFLSSNGMILGKTGVINAGSLYVMTPTKAVMDNFLSSPEINTNWLSAIEQRKIENQDGVVQNLGLPINYDGTITINGKIAVIDNIGLYAGKELTVVADGAVKPVLQTGVIDFAAFHAAVNLDNMGLEGVGKNNLTLTTDESGKIFLRAVTSAKSLSDDQLKDAFLGQYVDSMVGLLGNDWMPYEGKAAITLDGKISASDTLSVLATSTNGVLQRVDTVTKYGETVTREIYASTYALTNVAANVDIQSGAELVAAKLDVRAEAKNQFKDSAFNAESLGTELAGMATPIDLSADVALLGANAKVNVAQNASLTASKSLSVNANSVLDSTAGTSSSLLKVNNRHGLSASVIYSTVTNNAEVTVDGNLKVSGGDGSLNVQALAETLIDYGASVGQTLSTADSNYIGGALLLANIDNHANVLIDSHANLSTTGNSSLDVNAQTVSDIFTQAETDMRDATYMGAAVNLTHFDSDAVLTVKGKIASDTGDATLTAENLIKSLQVISQSGVGIGFLGRIEHDALYGVDSRFGATGSHAYFSQAAQVGDAVSNASDTGTRLGQFLNDTLKSSQSDNKLALSGAVTVVNGDLGAHVVIDNGAKITSNADTRIAATTHIEDYYFSGDSITRASTEGTAGRTNLSGGVLWNTLNLDTEVSFNDTATGANQTTITGKTVVINSLNEVEYLRAKRQLSDVKDAVQTLLNWFDTTSPAAGQESTHATLVAQLRAALTKLPTDFAMVNADNLSFGESMANLGKAFAELGLDMVAIANFIATEASEPVKRASNVLIESMDFLSYNKFFNTNVSSAATSNKDNLSLAAAVGWNEVDVTSSVKMGRNVAVTATAAGTVTDPALLQINAENNVRSLGLAGHVIPGNEFGAGTFTNQTFNPEARVTIAEGTVLTNTAGEASITTRNNNEQVLLSFSSSFVSADNSKMPLGINGMVGTIMGDSKTTTHVDDEVTINAKQIKVLADDGTSAINVAGNVSLATGGGSLIGGGAAVNYLTKTSEALVSDNDTLYGGSQEDLTATSQLQTERLDVSAVTSGNLIAIGIVGTATYRGTPDEPDNPGFFAKVLDGFNSFRDSISNVGYRMSSAIGGFVGGKAAQQAFDDNVNDMNNQAASGAANGGSVDAGAATGNPQVTVNAAGSLGLNMLENHVTANVEGARVVLKNDASAESLNVTAINAVEVSSFAGGVGLMINNSQDKPSSVAMNGALGLNILDNDVTAQLKGSTVTDADELNVLALNGGRIIALGLDVGLAFGTGEQSTSVGMSGSGSTNKMDNEVTAALVDNMVARTSASDKTDINAVAYQSDLQITGGLDVNAGTNKIGLGAAVNVALIDNKTDAYISGGSYNNIGNALISSLTALTQVNAGLSVGVSLNEKANGAQAALVYSDLNNTGSAGLIGADFSGENLIVLARDTSPDSAISKQYQDILDTHQALVDVSGIIDTSHGREYYQGVRVTDSSGAELPLSDAGIDGMKQVSVGGFLSFSSGNAVGASVVINDIDNTFTAVIEDSTVTANNDIEVSGVSDTLLVSVAAGIGVSSKIGGAGSVVWNTVDNNVSAGLQGTNDIQAKDVTVNADNAAAIYGVAGQIGGSNGNFAAGLELVYNKIRNITSAFQSGGRLVHVGANGNAQFVANNNSKIYGVGAHIVAAPSGVAISGAVVINRIEDGTSAIVNTGASLTGFEGLTLKATDDGYILGFGGGFQGSSNLALGGAVVTNFITGGDNRTEASASNATLSANSITLTADNNAQIDTLAIAGGFSSGSGAAQGSAATAEIARTIKSNLTDVNINKPEAVVSLTSHSTAPIFTTADAVVAGGSAAVGLGVAVNRINDTQSASIIATSAHSGSTPSTSVINAKSVSLNSQSAPTIKTIGIGAGVSSGTAGISGSTAYNEIKSTNEAFVKNASISTSGSLGVVAQSDEALLNYAGNAAVASTASVGLSASINRILTTTRAFVEDAELDVRGVDAGVTAQSTIDEGKILNDFISADSISIDEKLSDHRTASTHTGLYIDSSATHTQKSFIVNGAVSGNASVSGTVNFNQMEGSTEAYLTDSKLNQTAMTNGGDVTVLARDYSNDSGFVGSVDVAGHGAAVGLAIDTHLMKRTTNARAVNLLGDSYAKAVTVDAQAKQGITSTTLGAAGVGIGAGVAAMTTLVLFDGETQAVVDKVQNLKATAFRVNADHLGRTHTLAGQLAVGVVGAGAGAAVTVNEFREVVSASVKASKIKASGDVEVLANNRSNMESATASLSGGAGMVSGGVAVNYLDNKVIVDVAQSEFGDETNKARNITFAADDETKLTTYVGAVGIGIGGLAASVAVSTMDGQVTTSVVESKLYASENINITADAQRDSNQRGGGLSATVGGMTGVVLANYVGSKLSDTGEGSGELREAIRIAEAVNDEALKGNNHVLSEAEQNTLNDILADDTLTAQEANQGKTSTTVSDSTIAADKKVAIKADETTSTDVIGGGAALGVVTAGGAVLLNDINRHVSVSVNRSASDKTMSVEGSQVSIDATAGGQSTLRSYQAAVAAAGVMVSYSGITMRGEVMTAVAGAKLNARNGEITIRSKDTSSADAESLGGAVGTVAGLGALVTQVENESTALTVVNENTAQATGNINVSAERANVLTANTNGIAGGLWGPGMIGIGSTVNDDGQAMVVSNQASSYKAAGVTFAANNNGTNTSNARALSASLVGAVGAAVATLESNAKSVVNIGSGNTFDANTVSYMGSSKGSNHVESLGLNVGILLGIGYNGAFATNNATTQVMVGNNNYAATSAVTAKGETHMAQNLKVASVTVGGVVASGNNKAQSDGTSATTVMVDGGSTATRLGSLTVQALNNTSNDVNANGDGGGLINADGISAYAINNSTNNTKVTLTGKWETVGAMSLAANNVINTKVKADSLKASVVGYSGTKTDNTINATAEVIFAENSVVTSGSGIGFVARNDITSGADEVNAQGAGYGGITVSGVTGNLTVNSRTNALVSKNVQLHALRGSIMGDAITDTELYNRVVVKGAGMVSVPLAWSENNVTANDNLLVDSGANLRTYAAGGAIGLAAHDDQRLKFTSEAELQGGLAGDSEAETNSTVNRNNTLTVKGTLYSTDNVGLYTNADSTGYSSFMDLAVTADAYNKRSAVAFASAEVNSTVNQANKLDLQSSADIKSVRHIMLGASEGKNNRLARGIERTWYKDEKVESYATAGNGDVTSRYNNSNAMVLNANLAAGVQHKIAIEFNGDFYPLTDGKALYYANGQAFATMPQVTFNPDDPNLQHYKESIKYGTFNYKNYLQARLDEVKKLLSTNLETKARLGYEAEKVRLEDEMTRLGFLSKFVYNGEQKTVELGSMEVVSIRLPDMVASGGNIIIGIDDDAQRVSGNGALRAQGDPSITITNNTNAYLDVGDLAIGDPGGEVIINDVSYNNNDAKNKLGNGVSVFTSTSSGDSPRIVVKSTHNKTDVPVKDDAGTTGTYTPLPNIAIHGRIYNPLGEVQIINDWGDIVIEDDKPNNRTGIIDGKSIGLQATNGSIAQAYTDAIINVGSTPEIVYNELDLGIQQGISDENVPGEGDVDLSLQAGPNPGTKTGYILASGSIYLNALDINVNGLIQSGYNQYSLNIGEGGTPATRASSAVYNSTSGLFDYSIGYTYDAQGRKIVVDDVTPQGGRIYITGRISNTGNGRIFAADGASDIVINNATDNTVVLNKLAVGSVEGLIRITDTATSKVTEFTRGRAIQYNIGADPSTATAYASTTEYRPLSGLRYNWTNGTSRSQVNHYQVRKDFVFWGLWKYNTDDLGNWSTTPGVKYRTDIPPAEGTPLDSGRYIGALPEAGTTNKLIVYKKSQTNSEETFSIPISHKEQSGWGKVFGYGTEVIDWEGYQGVDEAYLNSLKADRPIQVGFREGGKGAINIASKGNIELNGDITGVAGKKININSTNGSVNRAEGSNAFIIGDNLVLGAKSGIGTNDLTGIQHRGYSDTAEISATTNSGNINIKSVSGFTAAGLATRGDVKLLATSQSGDVKVVAAGSILQRADEVSVIGNRIDLISNNGTIGTRDTALQIRAGQVPVVEDMLSASVSAKARSDINLIQTEGNMRLGRIESTQGDVLLTTNNGSFIDAMPAEEPTSATRADQLIALWTELGILGSGSGADAKLQAALAQYDTGIAAEYNQYLYYKDNPAAKADAIAEINKISDPGQRQERLAQINGLDAKYGAYASADAFITADPDGKRAIIANESYGWTQSELLYAIQDSIVNHTNTSTDDVNKPANVVGKNITLTARGGGVGKDEAERVVVLNDDLWTQEARKSDLEALASAHAMDVTWDDENAKATINGTRAIGIEMKESGVLNVDAQSNIYIAEKGQKPIYVKNVDARDNGGNRYNIRLLGKDGVYSVDNGSTANFSGKDLVVEAGTGSIGTAASALTTDITGRLDAHAQGLINLKQISDADLNIMSLYTQAGDVTLNAKGNILSVAGSTGYLNVGGALSLNSENGDIGKDGQGLRILVDKLSGLTAVAANIYIAGQATSTADLIVNDLTADADGTIKLVNTGTGIALNGDVMGGTLGITSADEVVQDQDNQDDSVIQVTEATITAANGITLTEASNKMQMLKASNTTSGDILVNNSQALMLKGISSAAGDASITTTAGAITLANDAYAYRNLTLKGQNGIEAAAQSGTTTANLKAETGFVSVTSIDGMTKLNTVNAGTDITVNSSGAATISTATAGDNIDVQSASGGVVGDTWTATSGNVKVSNQLGATTLNSVNAGTDIELITANGKTTLNTAQAGRDFIVAQGIGDVWLTSVDAGNDILINITTGNLSDMLLDPPAGSATAGHNIFVDVVDGGINFHTAHAGNDVTLQTHSDESLFVYDIESQQSTQLTNDNDGDIGFNRLIAQQNGTLKTFNGNIYVGAEFETVNGDMWVEAENGEIFSVGNLTSGSNMSLIGGSGVRVTGDINARRNVHVSNRVGGIDLNTLTSKEGSAELNVRESGDLAVKKFDVYNNTTLSTKVGNIVIGDGVAHTGSIKATSSDTGNISAASLNAANNITLTSMIGNISIGDRFANSGSAIANNGFINASVGGTGNIEASNLSAMLDVLLNTQSGNIRLGNRQSGTGLVESKTGAINLATGYTDMNSGVNPNINANYRPDQVNGLASGGDIDAHALLALQDILANSGAGNILMATLDGEDMVFTLGGDDTLIDVQHAVMSSNELTVKGDNISFGQLTHKENDGYIYIDLAGTNGPINNVVFGNIDTSSGVHVNGLHTNTGYIHTSSENFRLEGVYAMDRVYLSNADTRVTLFGRNPYLDDSDVQLYFVPTSAHPFARLSFQNEWPDGLEIYRVLHDDPRNPTAKNPDNQWSDLQTSAAVLDSNRAWLLLFDADGDGKPEVLDLTTDAIELKYPLVPDLILGAADKQLLIYQDLGDFFLHYPIIIEEEGEKK